MIPANSGCFPSMSSMVLSRKPGFLTRIELCERRMEFFEQFTRFNGEFVLIEMNYLERTCFGAPRMDPMYAEATMYILCGIDTSRKLELSEVLSISRAVSWEKHRENFVVYDPTSINVRTLQLISVREGGAFYRIITGDTAFRVFLNEFAKDPRNGGSDSLLVFWKAARKFDIDLSDVRLISDALKERREEALRSYVRSKALLFVDEYSGVGKMFTSVQRSSVVGNANEMHQKLLNLGLSDESIADQARELSLSLLDF